MDGKSEAVGFLRKQDVFPGKILVLQLGGKHIWYAHGAGMDFSGCLICNGEGVCVDESYIPLPADKNIVGIHVTDHDAGLMDRPDGESEVAGNGDSGLPRIIAEHDGTFLLPAGTVQGKTVRDQRHGVSCCIAVPIHENVQGPCDAGSAAVLTDGLSQHDLQFFLHVPSAGIPVDFCGKCGGIRKRKYVPFTASAQPLTAHIDLPGPSAVQIHVFPPFRDLSLPV